MHPTAVPPPRGALARRVSRLARFGVRAALVVSAAFVSGPDHALAQTEVVDDSRRNRALTLEAAVERAVERAPSVALSSRDVEIARASGRGASLRIPIRPHFQAEIRPNVDRNLGNAAPGYAGMVQVPLDLSGAPHARGVEADRRGDAAIADLEVTQLEVKLQTIEAYVRARLADEQVVSAEDSLAIAARVLSATRRRAEAGASSDVDVSIAAEGASSAEATLDEARAERIESYAALAALLDLDPGESFDLTTPVDRLPDLPEPASATDDEAAHPSVRAIEARAALAGATEERLERELAPIFGVYAGVDAAPASPVFGIVGIAMELPWGPRNQAPRAIAAAERDAAEVRAGLVDRALARNAVALRDAYASRKRASERLQSETVPLAERRLALTEEGFRLGRLDVFQVAVARDALVQTRQTRITALATAWATWTALARALGETP